MGFTIRSFEFIIFYLIFKLTLSSEFLYWMKMLFTLAFN